MAETEIAEKLEPKPAVASRGVELASTIMLAITAVLTAWSAFQSSKWSGRQSIAFSEATAARIEAARYGELADQQASLDVALFIAWVQAVAEDVGTEELLAHGYSPKPRTLSTFLYKRFRKEFRPAIDAWLETRPFQNAEAPATPFEMPQYKRQSAERAGLLSERGEQRAADARTFVLRSDRYVAITVVFAAVFFFVGVGARLETRAARRLMLGVGLILLIATAAVMASFPVVIV